MTRYEAIKILEYQYNYGQMEQSVHEALGMAISSLETDEAYQLEYEKPSDAKMVELQEDEVIRGLKALICFLEHEEGDIYPKQYQTHKAILEQAIDMAIKALEQEPTPKNDLGVDCISRDAVKYYIQAHIHEIITESGKDKNAHTNAILRALLNGVATMPSVTPQESILDKIRAEIDIARFIDKDTKLCKNANASGLEVAMRIIDKYKAEIEPQECEEV